MGEEYVYRRVAVDEYLRVVDASHDDHELEDAIIREALLYPHNFDIDNTPAGIPTVLARCMLRSSLLQAVSDDLDVTTVWQGYIDEEKVKITPRRDGRRLVVDDPITPLVIQISQAFPAYKPTEVLALPIEEILKLVAWSELVLGNVQPEGEREGPAAPGAGGRKWIRSKGELEGKSAAASARALAERMRMENARGRS